MNALLSAIPPSLIRELHGRRRATSIDLGLGEPLLRPDPGPLRAALAWIEEHGCPYSPNPGFLELRAAIAQRYGAPGLTDPAGTCVTVGSQEALHVAIKALLDPRTDEALIVSPAYPLYAKLCQMEGVAVRAAPLDPAQGFRPDAEAVLGSIGDRTRVIVLASPANPTGRVWPRAELERLADGLRRRPGHPIYLLSDEVYRELYYGEEPISPAVCYPHTVAVGSLSKSCALTGLRLGWAIAPPEAAPAIQKAHQFAVSCAGTFAQRAAIELLRQPELLRAHRPHYQAQRRSLLEALAAAGLSFIPPEGAFYCMIGLTGSAALDSTSAAFALLDRKDVVAIPGATFGAEGWLRISFVSPTEKLALGLQRIAEFLAE